MLPVEAGWEHSYLNFQCWSVDGSDSMSINKQCRLKYALFTFFAYSVQPEPLQCIALDLFFLDFANQLTDI